MEFAVTSDSLCLKLVVRNSIEICSIIAAACPVTREFVFVLLLFFHVIDNLDWKLKSLNYKKKPQVTKYCVVFSSAG